MPQNDGPSRWRDTSETDRYPAAQPSKDIAATIYAYAAGRAHVTVAELMVVASVAGIAESEARAAIDGLLERRLLRPTVEAADQLIAVPPATAGAELLMPAIRALQDRQVAISQAFAEITEMLPVYESSTLGRFAGEAVQGFTDLASVRRLITELTARARTEVLTSQPGGARPEEQLDEAQQRTRQLLERGIRMRTLYQHTAQFSQPTIRHATFLQEHGAQVRMAPDALMRMLVFDATAVLINLRDHPSGALLVREPSLVDFMVDTFERAWAGAVEFPLGHEREQSVIAADDLRQAILRLLVEGHEDQVIARRLGMSVRTLQRHLSECMKQIGARNRLHAGYLIHKLGIIEYDGRST